jgi:hypothetical protein
VEIIGLISGSTEHDIKLISVSNMKKDFFKKL